jgi:hypothetical protein
MRRMYSYVVDHDNGFAPNPSGGLCTLAKCKFSSSSRPNVVEKAKEGDWIVGTGGSSGLSRGESAGWGKLIYAMRVDRKISLAQYCAEYGDSRIDAERDPVVKNERYALLSRHFFYFGRNALDIDPIPVNLAGHVLEKRGPGYRSDFDERFIAAFSGWLEKTFQIGSHGLPCKPRADFPVSGCGPKLQPKRRGGCPPIRKTC